MINPESRTTPAATTGLPHSTRTTRITPVAGISIPTDPPRGAKIVATACAFVPLKNNRVNLRSSCQRPHSNIIVIGIFYFAFGPLKVR